VSKAGRRARMRRLINSGEWTPSTVLDATPLPQIDARTRGLLAERTALLRDLGRHGWQQEQDRRRAARIARHRERRRIA
jgi:chorismate mutase